MMGRYSQTVPAMTPWKMLVALLCVMLVVIGATVQVAHTHADGTADHADCSLCVAAHVGLQVSPTPIVAPAVTAVVARIEAFPPAALRSAVYTFALFTRPPPAYLSPA